MSLEGKIQVARVASGAVLKLCAVGRVVERLLREQAAHDAECVALDMSGALGCEATTPIATLATELRGILDADVPAGETPLQVALSELSEWSVKHRKVDPTLIAGAMLAEVIALARHQQGASWGDFVSQAFILWNASESEDENGDV